jgi:hypothetical protein
MAQILKRDHNTVHYLGTKSYKPRTTELSSSYVCVKLFGCWRFCILRRCSHDYHVIHIKQASKYSLMETVCPAAMRSSEVLFFVVIIQIAQTVKHPAVHILVSPSKTSLNDIALESSPISSLASSYASVDNFSSTTLCATSFFSIVPPPDRSSLNT